MYSNTNASFNSQMVAQQQQFRRQQQQQLLQRFQQQQQRQQQSDRAPATAMARPANLPRIFIPPPTEERRPSTPMMVPAFTPTNRTPSNAANMSSGHGFYMQTSLGGMTPVDNCGTAATGSSGSGMRMSPLTTSYTVGVSGSATPLGMGTPLCHMSPTALMMPNMRSPRTPMTPMTQIGTGKISPQSSYGLLDDELDLQMAPLAKS